MNEDTKKFTELAAQNVPNIWKACYPRRILTPQGFANPKYYAASLAGSTLLWDKSEMCMLPHTTGCLNAMLLANMGVPTYFVQNEFAQAVANTNLPGDFKLSELKWPLDAMLFVLPDSFVYSYFKFYTPYLSVSKCPKGNYPTFKQFTFAKDWEVSRFNPLFNTEDRMLIHFAQYSGLKLPADFSGNWPLKCDLSTIRNCKYVDATFYEAALRGIDYYALYTQGTPPTAEEEKVLNDKMTVFAVKLMLAFTARPHLIKPGGLARTAKIKHGKHVRDELWNPNLVGWDYVAQRSGVSLGGTHASPRLHWRPGHFTHQFIGKRGDPNFVPADALPRKATEGTIDWDAINPEVQAAFWKNHELRWIEPVLIDVLNDNTAPS